MKQFKLVIISFDSKQAISERIGVMGEPNQLSFTDSDKAQQIEDLIKQRDELSDRLDAGMVKIENAKNEGKNTTAWESHWIKLLKQYEAVVDLIKELKA